MIAVATGFDKLDKGIKEAFEGNGVNEIQIVNYREFLLQKHFDTIILSKSLTGQVEFDFLIFSLRANNVRVIFLTNENDISELKSCLNYGIYDLIFDPIAPAQVYNVYLTPKTFADVREVFVIVNGNNDKNKSRDIEKLMKMEEIQHTPLVQNDDYFDKTPVVENKVNQQNSQGTFVKNNNVTQPLNVPAMSREVQIGMPTVNNSNKYSVPQANANQTSERMGSSVNDNEDNYKEIKPLSNDDFTKRVIKEIEIKSVYQVPHDYKKTIVILSPESTGKTVLATNMAWYFSKKGVKTTLIDTDVKKKDVYYNFPIDKVGCLSRLGVEDDVRNLAITVGKNLSIYTENKDVDCELDLYNFTNLVTTSKKNSQVVIVDLDFSSSEEIIRNALDIADETIIVVDQSISTLNRVPEALYIYRNQLQKADLVVNKYYNIKHLEKEDIRDFFRGIEIYSGKTFDIFINRVFTISDDAKSILQGLAERTPAIEIRDNLILDDIEEICNSYFVIEKKK